MNVNVKKMVGFHSEIEFSNESMTATLTAHIEDGRFESAGDGVITDKDGNHIASFSKYGNLNCNFITNDFSTMAQVLQFINEIVSYCEANPTELIKLSNE